MKAYEEKSTITALSHFAIHVAVGAVIFAVIAGSALFLGFISEFLESKEVSPLISRVIGYSENGVMGLNILLVVVYLARTILDLIHDLRGRGRDG